MRTVKLRVVLASGLLILFAIKIHASEQLGQYGGYVARLPDNFQCASNVEVHVSHSNKLPDLGDDAFTKIAGIIRLALDFECPNVESISVVSKSPNKRATRTFSMSKASSWVLGKSGERGQLDVAGSVVGRIPSAASSTRRTQSESRGSVTKTGSYSTKFVAKESTVKTESIRALEKRLGVSLEEGICPHFVNPNGTPATCIQATSTNSSSPYHELIADNPYLNLLEINGRWQRYLAGEGYNYPPIGAFVRLDKALGAQEQLDGNSPEWVDLYFGPVSTNYQYYEGNIQIPGVGLSTNSAPHFAGLPLAGADTYLDSKGCSGTNIIYVNFRNQDEWEQRKYSADHASLGGNFRSAHQDGCTRKTGLAKESKIVVSTYPPYKVLDEFVYRTFGSAYYLIPRGSLKSDGQIRFSAGEYVRPALLHLLSTRNLWAIRKSYLGLIEPEWLLRRYYVEFALRYPKWCPSKIDNWSKFEYSAKSKNHYGGETQLADEEWDIEAATGDNLERWYVGIGIDGILTRLDIENDMSQLRYEYGCDTAVLNGVRDALYEFGGHPD